MIIYLVKGSEYHILEISIVKNDILFQIFLLYVPNVRRLMRSNHF